MEEMFGEEFHVRLKRGLPIPCKDTPTTINLHAGNSLNVEHWLMNENQGFDIWWLRGGINYAIIQGPLHIDSPLSTYLISVASGLLDRTFRTPGRADLWWALWMGQRNPVCLNWWAHILYLQWRWEEKGVHYIAVWLLPWCKRKKRICDPSHQLKKGYRVEPLFTDPPRGGQPLKHRLN